MEILQTLLLGAIFFMMLFLLIKNTNKPKLKKAFSKSTIFDSSALIDGRVVDVVKTGFLSGLLVVPSSVLREMQYLADNSDHEKRSRARHGLDVVKELQKLPNAEVEILDDGLPGEGGVDERLVQLCKSVGADLLTLDFNLNKVAAAEGIQVLNINELAQNLRMSYLPGEKRDINLVDKGQNKTQGVGYLEDGTMVVVENAGSQVGSSVQVEFTRAIQTSAGKMLFAKKTPQPRSKSKSQNKSVKPRKRTSEDNLVDLANRN